MLNTASSLKPAPTTQGKASIYRKLIQSALLATMLIPLGSVAVETASVTCGFSNAIEGSYGGPYCGGGDSSATPTTSRFDFGAYYLELMFNLVPGADFTVEVVTTAMDQDAFEAKAGAFSSYTCIALTDGGPCVDFEVIPSVPQPGNWTSYEIEIHWDKWTGQPAYNPALMRILHDIGDAGTRDYDEDMCLTALTNDSYLACQIDPDPGIRSGDTVFRSFTAALAPATSVPEPSSLILLATGVSGVLYRRRRRTRA